jgi:hypothetical protein
VASPLSDCTPGGFSSEPRTPQPASRRALAKKARPIPARIARRACIWSLIELDKIKICKIY